MEDPKLPESKDEMEAIERRMNLFLFYINMVHITFSSALSFKHVLHEFEHGSPPKKSPDLTIDTSFSFSSSSRLASLIECAFYVDVK